MWQQHDPCFFVLIGAFVLDQQVLNAYYLSIMFRMQSQKAYIDCVVRHLIEVQTVPKMQVSKSQKISEVH